MNQFRADLHCHTTCSDGTLNPQEVVKLAKDIGLKGLSITDHDTIDAYATAVAAAQEHDIKLISGVEFSAAYKEISVHILGYCFPFKSELILEFCKKHQARRVERNRAILEQLTKIGLPISNEELSEYSPKAIGSIGRPHIAYAMLKKGYVPTLQDAFKSYLSEGMPAYVSGNLFSVEETIDLLHRAGGIAIIAHPHLLKGEGIIPTLLKMPFDGIEAYYAKFYPYHNQRWLNIAKKKDWIVTGGSDFHGETKENATLGSSWVNDETFNLLWKKQNS